MKKQLYRVKQLADQRAGRAEKTDLLPEDLQHVEKTVEKIKHACTTTSKKLSACMQNKEHDSERRKKKLNQLLLGQGMVESAAMFGDGSIFGNVLMSAGEAQTTIASELAIHESEVEEQILTPMNKVLENDIPSINNLKKKLSKARLDMDSCKTRWTNAVKLAQNTSNSNKQDAQAKAYALQAEYEDNSLLFQQIQDSLATEMLNFVAGEKSYAQCVVDMMESQMRYHKAAFEVLEKCLPSVHKQMNDSLFRPVYGCTLSDHLRVTGREIAFVLEECVLFILDHALDAEGLFRLAGAATKIKKLKAAFDAGVVEVEEYVNEVHVVTVEVSFETIDNACIDLCGEVFGVLKLYLRELPEPMLMSVLYDEWITASKIKDRDQRLQALWTLVEKLPGENKCNLRYLICFLAKLAENSEVNKMTPSNIAIVIGPNLLWNNKDDGGALSIADTGSVSNIVESLIEHSTWFFPDGCEFKRHIMTVEQIDKISNRFTHKDEESPEPPSISGAGSLFSEVSKKLGWNKEGGGTSTQTDVPPSSPQTNPNMVSSSGSLGYYNPLAAQYDPDLDALYENPPVPPKKPPSTSTENDDFNRSTSVGSDDGASNAAAQQNHGHRRSPSGNFPKRPAPPIPNKAPPGKAPPSHKPPPIPKTPPKPKLAQLAKTSSNVSD